MNYLKKTKKSSNTSKHLYFIKIRKKIYKKVFTKYSNPYITVPLGNQDNKMENEDLSTYYDFYKINQLINKCKCRLYLNFIEVNLLYNPNEILIQFFERLISVLLLKYNIYNNCYFYPNYLSFDSDIQNHLFSYINKIKKINEQIINQAIGSNNKDESIKKGHQFGYSNILDSMISNDNISERKDYHLESKHNENHNVLKKNKKNSINEIEDLVIKLTDIEIEKEINDKKKREKELLKRKEEEEYLRRNFKETQKEIKGLNIDKKYTQKHLNSSLLQQIRRNSARQQVLEQKKRNSIAEMKSKFKNTVDFIGAKIHKEKKTLKKKNIIDQLIEITKSEKNSHEINYYKRLKNGYIKNVPESMIGINDFIENDKIKYTLENTHSYLRKISKNIDNDVNKMKKSYTLKKFIKFPNIYLYGNMNRNNINFENYNTSYISKQYYLKK